MSTLDGKFVSGNDIKIVYEEVLDEDGDIINLTGATIVWQIKRDLDSVALFTKEVGTGITVTDAVNGTFEVSLPKADTLTLNGEYLHEAVITDVSGNTVTITDDDTGFGKLTVRKRIADSTP